MAGDQHGPPDEQPRPPPAGGRPLVDPLTFAGALADTGPILPVPPAAGDPPVPGRRPAPRSADPAAVTARRHDAVTRSPSGTPPPAIPGPRAAGPPPGRAAAGEARPGPGRRPARQLRFPASLLAACAVLIAAGVVVVGLRDTAGHPAGGRDGRAASAALQAAAAARGQAARWVSREVSRSAVVACSARMCAALQAAGLPAADLLVLGPGAGDPLGAGVLVATPDLQAQFGARLERVYAPLALARFGSGPGQIDIRVVAPGGSAAYLAALRRDQAARRSAGAELLAGHRVRASADARAELTGGQVDARLLLLLPALAAVHPVHVLAFGSAGPRADPQLPLCSAQLAAWAAPAGLTQAGYARWLRGYLDQQRSPYRPRARIARAPGGIVITIEFSWPSPLGLLHGG